MKLLLAEVSQKIGKNASEMARETGINRNTINALLKSDVSDVKLSTLEKLCQTYHLKLMDLVSEVETAAEGVSSAQKEPRSRKRSYKQEGEFPLFTGWPWIEVAGSYQLVEGGVTHGFGKLDVYFKGDYGFAYWDLDAMRDLAEAEFRTYGRPAEYEKLYTKYSVYAGDLEASYNDSHDINPGALDESAIRQLFERIRSAYRGFWECSLFIDAFDTGVDQERIEEIAKAHNLDRAAVEILTTPVEMTFADERKHALLKLVREIFGKKTDVSSEQLRVLLTKHRAEFEQYKRNFDYYKSNYAHVKHITDQEIEQEIALYLADRELLQQDWKRLDSYEKEKQEGIAEVLKKYKLKSNPLWFFSNLTAWREHRKKVNLMGFHALDIVLAALEAKTGIPKKLLRSLSFDEVEGVLKGFVTASILERRYTSGALISIQNGSYKLFDGAEAISIQKGLEDGLVEDASTSSAQSKFLTGQTASQGYAKGIARVILTQDDFARFAEGEVLVTSMTRPEFVPLMKKAAAIVTNEGGITCHAAIVSRELGKPCVIGTKVATQVIKDGDLIEVRANHATVRILG